MKRLFFIMPRWELGYRPWLPRLVAEFARRAIHVTIIVPISNNPPDVDVDVDVFYIPREVLTPYASAPFSMPSHIKRLILDGEKVIISMPYNSLALSLSSVLKDIKGKYYVIWHHMCKNTLLGVETKAHARVLSHAKKVFVPYPDLPLPTEGVNVVRTPLPRIDTPLLHYSIRIFLPNLKLYEPFPYNAMLKVKSGATPVNLPGEWKDIWRKILDMPLYTLRDTFIIYRDEIW